MVRIGISLTWKRRDFRGHAETVQGQKRGVQTMLQVMQSANRNGTDIRTMT